MVVREDTRGEVLRFGWAIWELGAEFYVVAVVFIFHAGSYRL